MKDVLSKRGQELVREMSPLMAAHYNIATQLYNKKDNPTGYINMGTAESNLINDEVLDFITKVSRRMELNEKHIHYDYFYGSIEFRTAIAQYWNRLIFKEHTKRSITMDNVCIASGCSLALEMLATVLGDDGDVALVPAPFYSGFTDDFSERAKIELVPVYCGTSLDKEAFAKAYEEQIARGKKVCCILFSSPNNPSGNVYTKEEIQNIVDFAMLKDLDIVSDEIYAQTIHDKDTVWVSTLDIVPDYYLDRVHVTSSFAKDFALSGFRTGFLISFNKDLIKAAQNLAYYSGVSTHTQALLTNLLKAPELPQLLERNKEQLKIGHDRIVKALHEIGVETTPAQGGIFIMADFSKYMKDNTWDAEMRLWEKIYNELKINISPGKIFFTEKPGWFRICYAHEEETVIEACQRLSKLMK